MKKYFILIAMVAVSVSVSAADKNNASDEYYTCHMSKQLDRTSKSLGGNHFPEETETAKIKWDGSRFTVYGMNGGNYISPLLHRATEAEVENLARKAGVEFTDEDRKDLDYVMMDAEEKTFNLFEKSDSGISFSVMNREENSKLFQLFSECTLTSSL